MDPCADPADNSTCELVNVGGYLDTHGNDFWGVEAFVGKDGLTSSAAIATAASGIPDP